MDVRDVGLRDETGRHIMSYARERDLCLTTADDDFVQTRSYPPSARCRIVVLRIRRNSTARSILDLFSAFLQKADVISAIPGKLAIVERVRLRVRS